MSEVVISVEGLSKSYQIGHQVRHDTAVRDAITRGLRDFVRKASDLVHGRQIIEGDEIEEFWALKDVNFEVKQGEILGVIGRNGAGKSTLLKILSRITAPTGGRIVMRGSVASLLEVGTGFHGELSGRDNIFLNGAILGMRRAEIQRSFDEIVAFAGVERFLDTPVKRYSSGMYMRLAFAVAAHLESDILIIDEVLSVGDAIFQKQCLGKMRSISTAEGRTVIFVSHQMPAVLELCSVAMRLSDGVVVNKGQVSNVIRGYLMAAETATELRFDARITKPTITRLALNVEALARGDFVLEMDFESPFPLAPPVPGIVIASSEGVPVFGSNPRFHKEGFVSKPQKSGTLRIQADGMPLAGGTYVLSTWLGDWQTNYDHRPEVIRFDFPARFSSANRPDSTFIGHLEWPVKWSVN